MYKSERKQPLRQFYQRNKPPLLMLVASLLLLILNILTIEPEQASHKRLKDEPSNNQGASNDGTHSESTNFESTKKEEQKLNKPQKGESPGKQLTEDSSSALSADGLRIMLAPKWQLEGTLLAHFERLVDLGIEGDSSAYFILSKNLRFCLFVPLNAESLEHSMSTALDNGESSNFISRLKERYNFCEGITKEQRNSFYSYNEETANKGYVPAQVEFAKTTAKTFMQSQGHEKLERDEYIKTRDQFKQQKVGLLSSAAEQGSIAAMERLSFLHQSQNYGVNGLIKAYAYSSSLLEFTENNDLYNRHQWFVQRLSKRLTPEDIEQALALSEQLIEVVKNNGTLYPKH